MKYIFKPKTKLEKFGAKIYFLLVENFSQTFFVGGAVRDLLLNKKVTDIDIATSATPDEVVKILNQNHINYTSTHKKFGAITAQSNSLSIEITTLRKDLKGDSRYPKVNFIKNAKQDSQRRDFTINSLYLSLKLNAILDFQKGLVDLKKRQLKFIGSPVKRIHEDPLRIIRALRFQLVLKLNFEKETYKAIKNNFILIDKISNLRIQKEILKIKNKSEQNILKSILINPKLLDKHFK
jgi:tRNA nucleotidyltransferase/poly(A) polymerase